MEEKNVKGQPTIPTHLPVTEAAAIKFARGMARYRKDSDEPFVGDALYEAYEEILDALNYLSHVVVFGEGFSETVRAGMLYARVSLIAEDIRQALEGREEKKS